MTGSIDPLLPGVPGIPDDADVPSAGSPEPTGAIDLTAAFEQRRPHLLRLAAAITLDELRAAELVDECFADLQRCRRPVPDPAAQLDRAVVRAAVRRGGPRRGRRSRRREMSVRFDLSHAAGPAGAEAWQRLAEMGRGERAAVLLVHRRVEGEREAAELLGWSDRRVARAVAAAVVRCRFVDLALLRAVCADVLPVPDPPVDRTPSIGLRLPPSARRRSTRGRRLDRQGPEHPVR